jgi:hypothetical protein
MKMLMFLVWDDLIAEGSEYPASWASDSQRGLHFNQAAPRDIRRRYQPEYLEIEKVLDTWNWNCLTWVTP